MCLNSTEPPSLDFLFYPNPDMCLHVFPFRVLSHKPFTTRSKCTPSFDTSEEALLLYHAEIFTGRMKEKKKTSKCATVCLNPTKEE